MSGHALSATYNATGIWSYETKENRATGCDPEPNRVGIANVDQNGDSVLFIADGMPYTGTVSGVRYEVSTSYHPFPGEDGQTTDTITIDLKPGGTSGSGTGEWEYTEPGFSCSGEYVIEVTKLQDPPTHQATAVWSARTSNNVADGCEAETDKTGYMALNQNGNTFTYTDEMGIFTGRISGKKYLSSIQYEEDTGVTTQTIYVELSDNGQTGSGYEIWTWTDGSYACIGAMNIDIEKQPTGFTWDASGEWNYTEKDNKTGEVTTGEVTITQDGITFTIVGYKNKEPQAGLLSRSKYIATVSYPEGDGTKTESIVFDLTSGGTEGSGTISWYWTDGSTKKWGSSTLTLNKTATTNKRPNKPTLSAPTNGATNVFLTPTLETGSFSDPDRGDTHQQTEFEISTIENNFSSTVLSATSYSTTLIVPNFVLDVGKTYYWRARSYDNHSAGSAWSEVYSFTTTTETNDPDGDGVPDSQENDTVDLDGDGTPDSQQNHIKSLNTEVDKKVQMGVSRRDDPTVTAIGSIESIDPATVSDIARPYYMPFGLFGAELTLAKPTDAAEVTIYFSEPVPVEVNGVKVKWYVHNPIDGWVDYSKQATFSADRKSVRVKLKDWGYGDADGIPNGKIVDPCGLGLGVFLGGRVFDSKTGRGINNAEMTISEKGTNNTLALHTWSDGETDGSYFSMILPGTYTISVSASGYKSFILNEVVVLENVHDVTNDFALNPIAKAMPWLMLLLED